MTKTSITFTKRSLESNIIVLNQFYDFGETKMTDGCIPWPAALWLQ